MVYALHDAVGANLDRIQIVEGWLDAEGATHEQVHGVAWSPGRGPEADGRIASVGNTVDIASATWTNTIGASELATVWTDPDFDASQRAVYCGVIEIPTPRRVAHDALRLSVEISEAQFRGLAPASPALAAEAASPLAWGRTGRGTRSSPIC